MINKAGRQRMLSQRLAKIALELSQVPDFQARRLLVTEIHEAAQSWLTANQELTTILQQSDVTAATHLSELQPVLAEMLVAIADIESLYSKSKAHQPNNFKASRLVHKILDCESKFLARMENVVSDLERSGSAQLRYAKWMQVVFVCVMLLSFVATGVFVFRPLARRMEKAVCDAQRANQKLTYQANHDHLTRLPNRRLFFDRLRTELETSEIVGVSLSVCVFDVDHFKSVNDTYGHAAGDEVLMTLGRVVLQELREDDFAARLGGDEFALIFPRTSLANAHTYVDQIRSRMETVIFSQSCARPFSITVSWGLAESANDLELKSLLEAADRNLYAAKRQGRNCVAALSNPLTRVASSV